MLIYVFYTLIIRIILRTTKNNEVIFWESWQGLGKSSVWKPRRFPNWAGSGAASHNMLT